MQTISTTQKRIALSTLALVGLLAAGGIFGSVAANAEAQDKPEVKYSHPADHVSPQGVEYNHPADYVSPGGAGNHSANH